MNAIDHLPPALRTVLLHIPFIRRVKGYLINRLPSNQTNKIIKIWWRFLSIFYRNDLTKLGAIHGTDKTGFHFYTPHYVTHLKRFKNKKINLLEIGVGGDENPCLGGHSLRMWKAYFSHGKIFGLDIYDKKPLEEERIKIFKGSQVDKEFLEHVANEIGSIDVIVDDGSHINWHVIETFKLLFPKLKDGGIYVVEDVQTSYWPKSGGDSADLKNPATMMNYFKSLTDCLNHQEFAISNYEKSYYDKKIISMHFYHNMIFIYKGNNDEKGCGLCWGVS
jgi:demethylmacrocin O-methyltransferase